MKYWILDVNGQIPEENKFFRGMLYGNHTLIRIFYEKCLIDAQYDQSDIGGDPYYENRMNLYSSSIIPQQFDFTDFVMSQFRAYAVNLFWFLCAWVPVQFVAFFLTRTSLLPCWTLIEYMQLFAYIPLMKYNLMPYLYDLFRPF
jgi:hypothetical protein